MLERCCDLNFYSIQITWKEMWHLLQLIFLPEKKNKAIELTNKSKCRRSIKGGSMLYCLKFALNQCFNTEKVID